MIYIGLYRRRPVAQTSPKLMLLIVKGVSTLQELLKTPCRERLNLILSYRVIDLYRK